MRERGDVISFVQQMDHLTFPEAIARLGGKTGERPPTTRRTLHRSSRRPSSETVIARRPDQYRVLSAAAELYANRLLTDNVALEYLARRGFARDLLERHHVGYAAGDELIAYLRWRGFPFGAALRTGLINDDGRELLTGRITFPEYVRARPYG